MSQWEVTNLELSTEALDGKRFLHLRWQENGKSNRRVLRLWRMWEPWVKSLVQAIPENSNELCVEYDDTSLPSGAYLAHFDYEDPWTTGSAEETFPAGGINTVAIELDYGQPYVRDWAVEWLSTDIARITGAICNFGPGKKVVALLLGVTDGKAKAWRGEGSTDYDNLFTVTIEDTAGVSRMREGAHWVMILADEPRRLYHAAVLDEPGALEWPLSECLMALLPPEQALDARIKIHCEDGHLAQPLLPLAESRRLLQALLTGDDTVDLNLKMEETRQKVTLSWPDRQKNAYLHVNGWVECTGCGRILPSQEAWYRHTGYHRKCKSLKVNVTEVRCSLLLLMDHSRVISAYRERYPLAGRNPLILCSSRNAKLPDEFVTAVEGDLDIEKAAPASRPLPRFRAGNRRGLPQPRTPKKPFYGAT